MCTIRYTENICPERGLLCFPLKKDIFVEFCFEKLMPPQRSDIGDIFILLFPLAAFFVPAVYCTELPSLFCRQWLYYTW